MRPFCTLVLPRLSAGPKPVLFVGSGHTWHNFEFINPRRPRDVEARVAAYEKALDELLAGRPGADGARGLETWTDLPNATYVQATGNGDHLMPLVVCAAAAGDAKARPIPLRAFNLDTTDWAFAHE